MVDSNSMHFCLVPFWKCKQWLLISCKTFQTVSSKTVQFWRLNKMIYTSRYMLLENCFCLISFSNSSLVACLLYYKVVELELFFCCCPPQQSSQQLWEFAQCFSSVLLYHKYSTLHWQHPLWGFELKLQYLPCWLSSFWTSIEITFFVGPFVNRGQNEVRVY